MSLGWLLIVTFLGVQTQEGRAATGESYTRVRSTNQYLIALVREGFDRSGRFRELVETIQRSNVIVLVQPGTCAGGRIRSCLVSVTGSARDRHIRIKVDPRHTIKDGLIAAIAHELQHAVEIAEHPDVTDGSSVLKLYRQLAFGRCHEGLSEECETKVALDTERVVLVELLRGPSQTLRRPIGDRLALFRVGWCGPHHLADPACSFMRAPRRTFTRL